MRTSAKLRKKSGSAIAEFGPALFIFLIIFLIPCVNLVFYAAAVVSAQHIVEETSRAAGVSNNQTEAIKNVGNTANQWLNGTGVGSFAHLTPANTSQDIVANGQHTGCELDILATDSSGTHTIQITNNNPVIPLTFDDPQNPNTNTSAVQYEYQVTGVFTVTPFLNMAGIPFVGQIPAIGAPTTLSYVSKSQVENVAGLDN